MNENRNGQGITKKNILLNKSSTVSNILFPRPHIHLKF